MGTRRRTSELTLPEQRKFLREASFPNPPHDFSVRRIGETENQDHGIVLKAWYSNNRMLNFDQFWIDIQ
ncbi:hypothetical protein [Nonomuraea glycinis]|uniref:hypothetical protein n=1 Tax=Nonomuraea glycinis TaxID=2047744 RepID=UPI002E13623F|nr:hypothetical protein OHA68_06970 [Nonomuraea glycinis]